MRQGDTYPTRLNRMAERLAALRRMPLTRRKRVV